MNPLLANEASSMMRTQLTNKLLRNSMDGGRSAIAPACPKHK
jgi:hypothetical protein